LLHVAVGIATIAALIVVMCTSQLLAWHFHNNELQTELWFNLHFNILQ